MTGLEKIVKQIQEDAGQSASALIAEAQADAAKLASASAAARTAKTAAIAAQSKADVENALASAKSAAALATRRAVLSAKQEIIGAEIDSARDSVYALPPAEYFDLLLHMTEKFSLPQEGEILFSADDLARLPADFEASLAKSAKGRLVISKETRAIRGGFVLVYGGIEENCSIEALFYAARERLQDRVQEILFA